MSPAAIRILICLAVAAGASSCAAATGTSDRTAGGTVVEGSELMATGLLLDALEQRVPSLSVSRETGGCPNINLRGRATPNRAVNPAIYVDGTRMGNTCILGQLSTAEIDRVELYPVAARRPPGYAPGPGGLILVFRVR